MLEFQKNQCFYALELAKQMLENEESNYICNALNGIALEHPALEDVVELLRRRIEHELTCDGLCEGVPTLYEWVDRQAGLQPTRYLGDPIWRLCRLAWVDRMMEDYK